MRIKEIYQQIHFYVCRKTPVTLQEGEEFGKGEKPFHFACFDKVQKKNEAVVLSS